MNNYMNILYTGPILEGPINITYIPGLTLLPIELICNVTLVPVWIVNGTGTIYLLSQLTNGVLPRHSRRGSNILVNIPFNNTEYICVSTINSIYALSDPAYITIAST